MINNLKILDMPESERPKEKLLRYGEEALTNSELLAIILRTGTKGENVLNLSQRIAIPSMVLVGCLSVATVRSQEWSMKVWTPSNLNRILSLGNFARSQLGNGC